MNCYHPAVVLHILHQQDDVSHSRKSWECFLQMSCPVSLVGHVLNAEAMIITVLRSQFKITNNVPLKLLASISFTPAAILFCPRIEWVDDLTSGISQVSRYDTMAGSESTLDLWVQSTSSQQNRSSL